MPVSENYKEQTTMKKCCFIIPYFGKFPNYFPLFLKTCGHNPDFNWLVITDDRLEYDYPSNFTVLYWSFEKLKRYIQDKFDFRIALDSPYKLCDYKPAYGYIFDDYIRDFLFWGHCDVDTLMGKLGHFITPELLQQYDKLFCLGHMTLYKNTYENNRVFMSVFKRVELYKNVFSTNDICWFDEEYKDEYNINELFRSNGKQICMKDFSMNVVANYTGFVRVEYLGIKNYPQNHGYKQEAYIKSAVYTWNDGHLFRFYTIKGNQLKREEFLYIHIFRRRMSFQKYLLTLDKFKIIPNKFLPMEVEEITVDNIGRIKKHTFCLQYYDANIKPRIKKLLKRIKGE